MSPLRVTYVPPPAATPISHVNGISGNGQFAFSVTIYNLESETNVRLEKFRLAQTGFTPIGNAITNQIPQQNNIPTKVVSASYDGIYVAISAGIYMLVFNTNTEFVATFTFSDVITAAMMSADASRIAISDQNSTNQIRLYEATGPSDNRWASYSSAVVLTWTDVRIANLKLNRTGTFLAVGGFDQSDKNVSSVWSRSFGVWVNQQTIPPSSEDPGSGDYSDIAISDNGLRLVRSFRNMNSPNGTIEFFKRDSISVLFPNVGILSGPPPPVSGQNFYGSVLIGTADLDKVLVSGENVGNGTYLVDPETGSSSFQTFFYHINQYTNQSMSADGRIILCSIAPTFVVPVYGLQAYFNSCVLVDP